MVDEDFTINHVYHIVFPGLPTGPLAGPIVLDQFVVSEFGQSQTLNAEVDHVVADMDTGDDSVTVLDTGSPTTYAIDGGDGNDTIDIEGAYGTLFGGTGNDTIQAGDGSRIGPTIIAAGEGEDTLLFGDGQLSNVVPQAVFEIRSDQSDLSIDQLTIDNSQSRRYAVRIHSQRDSRGRRPVQLRAGHQRRRKQFAGEPLLLFHAKQHCQRLLGRWQ